MMKPEWLLEAVTFLLDDVMGKPAICTRISFNEDGSRAPNITIECYVVVSRPPGNLASEIERVVRKEIAERHSVDISNLIEVRVLLLRAT